MADLGLQRTGSRWPGRGCSPTGAGPANPAGLDFYRRLVDELLGHGHRALAHALPLGPAAAAGGRRRLAGPGHRRPVRRLRRARARRARRPGARTGPRSTSRGARRSSATRSGVHAPGRTEPARGPGRRAPPAARPRAGRPGAAGAATRAAQLGITLNLYPVDPASGPAEDADAARRIDGLANRFFLDPVLRGPLPGGRAWPTSPRCQRSRVRPGRRPERSSPRRSTCSGSTTTAAHVVAGSGRRPGPAADCGAVARRAASSVGSTTEQGVPVTAMGWEIDAAGPVRGAAAGSPRLRPACRSTSPRTAPPSTTRRGPTARSTTRTGWRTSTAHLRAAPARDRRPGSTCAATSSGRCWTTSSGRRATQAVRARLRRLRHPAPDPQGQRALVRRSHPPQRPAAGPGLNGLHHSTG